MRIGFILFILTALVSTARGATWTAESLLISSSNVLYEVSPNGTQIQSFTIPSIGDARARDIVMDSSGRVHVYNGTFDPFLSTFDPATENWQHRTFPGWSTVNNGTYGGIGVFGDSVFLTDMRTFGDNGADEAQGIIRFDFSSQTFTRFATNIEPIDLTVGFDGRLYALHPGGSPGGRFVEVYDPNTLAHLDTISLADIFGHTAHRSIAVDADGSMLIADWDGDLQKIDSDGNLLNDTQLVGDWIGRPISASLYDVDVGPNGTIAIGSRFGEVFVSDNNFSAVSDFDLGGSGIFVAFVTVVPEPSALPLFSAFATALLGIRRRGS